MRACIHIRVYPETDRGDGLHFSGDARQPTHFGFGLDVETQDTGCDCFTQFRLALANARENDSGRIAAGGEHTLEFTTGHDIETTAKPREDIKHSGFELAFAA